MNADEFQRQVTNQPRTGRESEVRRERMSGDDVRQIREALGRLLGRHVSQQDLGVALGLAPGNAATTVRRWEDSEPSGPAAVALTFMREATDSARGDMRHDFRDGMQSMVLEFFGEIDGR